MAKEQHSIDDIFRQSLGDYQETSPAGTWEAIERKLDDDSEKPVGFFWRWPLIFLALILAVGGIWLTNKFVNNRGTSVKPKIASAHHATNNAVSKPLPTGISGYDTLRKKISHPLVLKNKQDVHHIDTKATSGIHSKRKNGSLYHQQKRNTTPAATNSSITSIQNDKLRDSVATSVAHNKSTDKEKTKLESEANNKNYSGTSSHINNIVATQDHKKEKEKVLNKNANKVSNVTISNTSENIATQNNRSNDAHKKINKENRQRIGNDNQQNKENGNKTIRTKTHLASLPVPFDTFNNSLKQKALPSKNVHQAIAVHNVEKTKKGIATTVSSRDTEEVLPARKSAADGSTDQSLKQPKNKVTPAEESIASNESETDTTASVNKKSHAGFSFPKISFHVPPVSVSAFGGYEFTFPKPFFQRADLILQFLWYVNPNLAVGLQPAFRWGNITSQTLNKDQNYFRPEPMLLDSVTDVDGSGNIVHTYFISQTADSIIVPTIASRGTVWDVTVPVLLYYQKFGSNWHFYGGPSFSAGGKIKTETTGDLQTYLVREADIVSLTNQQLPASAFDDYFGLGKRPQYSSYDANSFQLNNPSAIHIGYMVGFGFEKHRFLFDISLQQQLSGYKRISDPLRKTYTSPGVRVSIGYRLFWLNDKLEMKSGKNFIQRL